MRQLGWRLAMRFAVVGRLLVVLTGAFFDEARVLGVGALVAVPAPHPSCCVEFVLVAILWPGTVPVKESGRARAVLLAQRLTF